MLLHWNRRRTLGLLFTALSALGQAAQAAEWPSRPVHLIVGFPAGSSPDLTARALAEPLGKALGQPVIVDNKVGAGGNIAADAVAKAAPDGNTLLMAHINSHALAPSLQPKLGYVVQRDFVPICLVGVTPNLLRVGTYKSAVEPFTRENSSPEAKEAYAKLGHEPMFSTPEYVRGRIVNEQKVFAPAVKAANLKPE